MLNENKIKTCRISDGRILLLDKYQNIIRIIEIQNIIDIEIIEDIDYEEKKKSVLCRTAFGWMIAGTAGAIIGYISGITPELKERKLYYLELEIQGEDENLYIGADFKTLKKMKEEILKYT